MQLNQVQTQLKRMGIEVAIDLGEHSYCSISSNCPKAIEVRRVIEAARITPEMLVQPSVDVFATPVIPTKVSARMQLVLGSETIEVDCAQIVTKEASLAIQKKVNELETKHGQYQNYLMGLQRAYSLAMQQARAQVVLPQLAFSRQQLLRYKCTVTRVAQNYSIMFREIYNPMWIVSTGKRWQIEAGTAKDMECEIILEFTISAQCKFVSIMLLTVELEKFQHYHGRATDCWGQVKIPELWDGTMTMLVEFKEVLMKSLATINEDSLMMGHPPDFMSIEALKKKSVLLGQEGVISKETEASGTANHWGTGWRT